MHLPILLLQRVINPGAQKLSDLPPMESMGEFLGLALLFGIPGILLLQSKNSGLQITSIVCLIIGFIFLVPVLAYLTMGATILFIGGFILVFIYGALYKFFK